MKTSAPTILLGLAAVVAAPAHADIIQSTDDPYCTGICLPVFGFDIGREQSVGIRFQPSRDYRFDSAGVWLFDTDNSSIDFLTLSIREGNDSTPSDTVLESRVFAAPSTLPFRPALATVTSNARPLLRAGQYYWLVLESPGSIFDGSSWAAASPGNGFQSIRDGQTWQPGGPSAWGAHIIEGTPETVPGCPADVDNGSSTGTPDGAVTIEDLLYYLGLYDAGSLGADLDDGSGTGTRDGGVTIEDLLYYLQRYDAGC